MVKSTQRRAGRLFAKAGGTNMGRSACRCLATLPGIAKVYGKNGVK
ncbi:MAG: hypothetical protein M1319_07035 [Chloroflexi bacterium]|nr:hypothetical protein [Chloroflexota bacterium]